MSHEGRLVSVDFSFIASHLDSHAVERKRGRDGGGRWLDGYKKEAQEGERCH